MKKPYTAPEVEIVALDGSVLTVNSNELPILGYDPDDPALDIDSREYDQDYARSLGLS